MCNFGDIYIEKLSTVFRWKKKIYILDNSLLKEVMTLFNPN